jgi:hypothetical protein
MMIAFCTAAWLCDCVVLVPQLASTVLLSAGVVTVLTQRDVALPQPSVAAASCSCISFGDTNKTCHHLLACCRAVKVALTITKWSSINQVTAIPKHPLVRKYCTGYWHWQAYTRMCSAPPLTLLKSTTGPGTVKRQAGRHTDQPHSCRQDSFVRCAATTALLCKSSTACGCAQTVTIHTS